MKQSQSVTKAISSLILAATLTITASVGQVRADAVDPFVGEVQCGGYNFCPAGWLSCDGQQLQIASYEVLFVLLGTTYGGNGTTNFNLPDLRGRVMLHQGPGPGLTGRTLGEIGGTESHQTSQAELPAHSHKVNALSGSGDSVSPSANTLWADSATKTSVYSSKSPNSPMSSAALAASGGSASYSIMKPFLVNKCCIAVEGIFPAQQ